MTTKARPWHEEAEEWVDAEYVPHLRRIPDLLRAALAEREALAATGQRLSTLVAEVVHDLRAENEQLRAALRKYGRHEPGCGVEPGEGDPAGALPCTCGYSAALKRAARVAEDEYMDGWRVACGIRGQR